MIAGHVDKGENFTQAIIREAYEEAGIIIKREEIEMVHVMSRKNESGEERIDLFFKAKRWKNEPNNMEPNKCDDWSWFENNKLPKNIQAHVLYMFECVKNRKFYSEYGWD